MEQIRFFGRPILAVKLSPAGQKQQQGNNQYLTQIIQNVLPDSSYVPLVEPFIRKVPLEDVDKNIELATQLDPTYEGTNFNTWYQVTFTLEDRPSVVKLVDDKRETLQAAAAPNRQPPGWLFKVFSYLSDLKEQIEDLHYLIPNPPPVDASDDPVSGSQGYLDAAKSGIDARFAWTVPGGDGANANIVDIEQGWNLNHVDLVQQNIALFGPGQSLDYFRHGTNVLGVILMRDNNQGGIGIAPAGKGRVVGEIFDGVVGNPGIKRTAEAILAAVAQMTFGDILLLESQTTHPNDPYSVDWPAEVEGPVFQAIRVASALGITVIEPAGNGSHDLDLYTNANGVKVFLRSDPAFKQYDSGAVFVASATDTVPHTPYPTTNLGSRIDCFAWGQNVMTSGNSETDLTNYSNGFNSTSAAASIVAGAAMIIQSVAQTQLGYKLSPFQLRKVLRTGTASANGLNDRIGWAQPDLKTILQTGVINALPNMYIRDNIADSGARSSGILSASPDIIVLQNPVGNPNTSFGQMSNTKNSGSLCQSVIKGPGTNNTSIYIRALNMGGSIAQAANASVYWSLPSTTTLCQPNMWLPNKIGDANIGPIPTNNVLTVSSRLPWPDATIPDPGHYCFICIGRATDDDVTLVPQGDTGTPIPPYFPDFVKWVQENNNVAWRNFNVISAPPPPQNNRPYHSFPFIIPGAYDLARIFRFRAIASLLRGSTVLLKLPFALSRALGIRLRDRSQIIDKEQSVLIPLNAYGEFEIGEGLLEKELLAQCELQVTVPDEIYTKEGIYEVSIAQEWEGIEIGRLTFRFGQRDRFPGDGGDKGGDNCEPPPESDHCSENRDEGYGKGGANEGKHKPHSHGRRHKFLSSCFTGS